MIDAARIAELNESLRAAHEAAYGHAVELLVAAGVDPEAVVLEVARLTVAAPSWALGAGGTRFSRFPVPGEPRNLEEKIADVAAVNALTGANRTISVHLPWDRIDDPEAVRSYASDRGIGFDAVNSNTFQDNPETTRGGAVSYKFGSLSHSDPAVRRAALDHNLDAIRIGEAIGSRALAIWLADGTSFPGQADFRMQFERVAEGLHEIHDALPEGWELLLEHKPFEPAFYSTVNSDWGSSLLLAQAAGDNARCLVDLGHHLPNTNIEQIVSRLAMVGRLGGFHFNDARYADDDLTVGSVRPYQLFLVVLELVLAGEGHLPELAYMIDASHNLKDPLEDLLQSTDALQHALALALCVNREELREAQLRNDVAWAGEVLQRAFRSDVRPLVAEARRRNGAALQPLRAFRALGYRTKVAAERGVGARASGL